MCRAKTVIALNEMTSYSLVMQWLAVGSKWVQGVQGGSQWGGSGSQWLTVGVKVARSGSQWFAEGHSMI